MPQDRPGRLALLVDLTRCVGCQSCAMACKAEHGVPVGAFFSWIKTVEIGAYPDTRRQFLFMTCNHCEEAPCLDGCPVSATWRTESGIVRVDPHRCIGCKYCLWACPYSVRVYDPDVGVCRKCELCAHRVEEGVPPACVEACPTGSLRLVDLDTGEGRAAVQAAGPGAGNLLALKPELGTRPRVLYQGASGSLAAALLLGSYEPGASDGR